MLVKSFFRYSYVRPLILLAACTSATMWPFEPVTNAITAVKPTSAANAASTTKAARITVSGQDPVPLLPSATTYYVSPTGSDSNAGTEAAPFKTIQKAASLVNPGDTVIVEDGIYTKPSSQPCGGIVCISRSGNASSLVTFKSRNKWGAKLDGQNGIAAEGFSFTSGSGFVRIEGFEIYGVGNMSASASGIDIYAGGHDTQIVGNKIHNVGNNCAPHSNGQVGIFIQAPNVTVEDNVIHDIGRRFPSEGCSYPGGFTGYQTLDHGIYCNGNNGPSGRASGIKIRNNVFYNTKHGWGVQFYPGTIQNVNVFNNTFAFGNPNKSFTFIVMDASLTNVSVRNNIFYNPEGGKTIELGNGLSANNVSVTNNVTSGNAMTDGTPVSGMTLSNNWISTNAMLVNPTTFDFHLQAASPAIDNGMTLAEVPDDIEGRARPQGGNYDIGAYERASPTLAEVVDATVTAYDDGVSVQWRTGREVENLGFNVYRRDDANGKLSLINQQLIAGSAFLVGTDVILGSGHSYQWWDNGRAGKSTSYWLEDLDINGKSRWHGPYTPNEATDRTRLDTIQQAKTLAALSQNATPSRPFERRADLSVALNASSAGTGSQALIASSPNKIKFSVKGEGWYRVAQQELLGAGLNPSVDPRLLKLFVDGREQAIRVSGQEDGHFDLTDSVEFYGTGIDSPFSDSRTYYLVNSKQAGLRIAAIQSPGAPTPSGSFAFTVERRDRSTYFSALRNGDKENFFGAVIASQPVDQLLTLKKLSRSGGSAVLEVALQGVNNVSHLVAVKLNGVVVGQLRFQDQSEAKASITVPQSMLREGDNKVTLTALSGTYDVSLVDYIRLTYQHTFNPDADVLEFQATAGQQLTIDGFTSNDIQVFDVSDPYIVKEVFGYKSKQKAGTFSVSLIAPGHGQRTLLALTKDKAARVAETSVGIPSNLRDPQQGGDLVIITRRELFDAAEKLAQLRQKQGLSVSVIDVEAIYDEFSFGQKTPQAVKDFIGLARTEWKKPIKYVLFFGEASLDPKNYLGLGNFDLVPTRLVDTTYMETSSDDWFADFNDDGIGDLAVGRLPARTAAEAEVLVDKLTSYEQSSGTEEALLVSDLNDGFDFEGASEQLIPLIPSGLRVTQINRGQMGDAAAHAAILDAINRGQRIVNYAGHGSVDNWRGGMLNSSDARQLQNRDHLSVFAIMNCLNAYFQDPALESLGEALLKSPGGGAVAVWASSAMTPADVQVQINRQFYRQLFDESARLGDAVIRAKTATSDLDARRTWILLGDPTMRIK